MRKRVLICGILLGIIATLGLWYTLSNKPLENPSFSIRFIDVGQGDAALVECDGHYMLIDGGDVSAGFEVYHALEGQGVRKLDVLVMSHLHQDHIGGLVQALTYTSSVGLTLSNADYVDRQIFRNLKRELQANGTRITIPEVGDTYELGSAIVEVIDVSAEEENDSLVLLITYGETKFLFTGDIEETAQTRICDRYENDDDKVWDIDLIKMPHHGSYTGTLYRFLRLYMPEYAIISAGEGNDYGHPHKKTLNLLENEAWSFKVYRTDVNGDIVVRSDGKRLSVEGE